MEEARGYSTRSGLEVVTAFLTKLLQTLRELLSAKPEVPSAQGKWDVRVASPRKLFRALHDFLDAHGYAHEYEPLKAERDAIGDVAIFQSELVGEKDSAGRDRFKLILGIVLFPTIVLIPLAVRLLEGSHYSLRTIAKIGVEGEAYRSKTGLQGNSQSEMIGVVSDARVTLDVRAGVAGSDYEISRPAKDKRELMWIAEQQRELKDTFAKLLLKDSPAQVRKLIDTTS